MELLDPTSTYIKLSLSCSLFFFLLHTHTHARVHTHMHTHVHTHRLVIAAQKLCSQYIEEPTENTGTLVPPSSTMFSSSTLSVFISGSQILSQVLHFSKCLYSKLTSTFQIKLL